MAPSVPRVSGRVVPRSIPEVAPSAPGNVPKRLSNERFSFMRKTTCLIGHRVLDGAAALCDGDGVADGRPGGVERGDAAIGGGGLFVPLWHAAEMSAKMAASESARSDLTASRGGGRGTPRGPRGWRVRACGSCPGGAVGYARAPNG